MFPQLESIEVIINVAGYTEKSKGVEYMKNCLTTIAPTMVTQCYFKVAENDFIQEPLDN